MKPGRDTSYKMIKPETKNLEEWIIKIGDLVEVNSGELEGDRGTVKTRYWWTNTAVVTGVNESSKEVLKEDSSIFDPEWEVKKTPEPIHFRMLSLIDPETNERTNARWEQREVDGKMRWQRISEVSNQPIPIPRRPPPDETKEYAERLCTRNQDVLKVTYVPLPAHSLKRAREQLREQQTAADSAADDTPPTDGSTQQQPSS